MSREDYKSETVDAGLVISNLIEMVSKVTGEFTPCHDPYCQKPVNIHEANRCIVTNAPYCDLCIEEHRDECGLCTLHLEQRRQEFLKGVPTLDLERWADDQQSGPIGAVVDGDRLLPQSSKEPL